LNLTEEALEELLKFYCRESGVRSLEQHIEKICDKVSDFKIQEKKKKYFFGGKFKLRTTKYFQDVK
jgi:ATP-dependent Lon protease